MKSREIFSKSWCDLVFDQRNKQYGAYRIRQTAGRRYRRALIMVVLLVTAFGIVPAAFQLYLRYRLYESFKDAADAVKQLQKLEKEEGYTVKHLSAGRGAPAVSTTKGATEKVDQITDVAKEDIVFGIDGDETVVVDSDPTFEDRDTLHNRDRKDLPVEGPQLIAVDVVKEMPLFPGGIKALMEWLEANIPYPKSCIDKKIEGDMELTFYVGIDGRPADARVSKSLHPDLDAAALRALQNMPRWTPGRTDHGLTAVCITLPLHFQTR